MISAINSEIIPENWYNVIPDLPEPLPPPKDSKAEFSSINLLNKILPKEVLRQEFTFKRYEKIPDEVIEQYEQIGRPTPLIRAKNLEKYLDYGGKIFYKFEGATATGSHKINTAIAQAYYAKNEGVNGVTTETGAGQWGSATALAASLYKLPAQIFMVKVSFIQKPLRKIVMNLYNGNVVPSPSNLTEYGRKILSENPDHPGTLGIGISEAVEYALDHDYRYMVASVMNSALTHQSVIGLETKKQLELIGEHADVLIGCVGGGSNFGGFTFPFIPDHPDTEIIATTADEVPKFSKGDYKYDLMDSAGVLPEVRMYSLGADFVPPTIYAGGLRYHGASPSLSLLINKGRIKSDEVNQEEVKNAIRTFANTQGIIAAPESGHAIATMLNYVKAHKNEKKTIVVNVSGHGLLDLSIFQ
ncbi:MULTISPECIES: TrpB-like pyridoxal phosphate-dependent enzyme [Acidiplasma]|jgi:tryptophan synthase beta chain|uniref:Tryptophan synthase beta chain n=3 Tax=Acidiplasma TaxID=507753 RepID=A0A0Q0RKR4_9ARCH|nr:MULTISPECIES: TrpB-like pyridoxal phosphate-dependent enzyme [Acidiplasma]KJE49059.1 tryptophan synthase beta chain [Acidiplasma sp. MBA-1]KPV47180.1 tryptophan synthase beta chain [Acidiplasma aeolicum]KQB34444.1 tryptophan synthase beta chain [Acidiplasma aeolicum]KQB36078.1 tryptophan synthase beta chain [Acidiplasma cupricumulans]WMT54506.1 MAG: TrpB-like pyridoxal phosphate-dependent enzyme [Acidiplasma sp.]